MAIFKPKYRDKDGNLVESDVYWYEFLYAKKRIRESAKTTRKTIAIEAEKRRKLDCNGHTRGFLWKRLACALTPFWTAPRLIACLHAGSS